ncbi:hypothetical protein C6Y40_23750 [Alteromonas alba]|uniref:Sulfotransferase domain-containing protein n=1 Tax=Alteromonas alba TaxID=2079529 RepID=A0A2S9V3N9_9ALTE|nr:sulfotransferase domain-containing protein [Alteromonas alba]PRO71072.1 hypothetical protein C6Y40_23750 [Alteromonas alba]
MSTKNILPNLFLAGAPKCGTTSVYDWLVSHPDISGGVDKELFYLVDKADWKFNEKSNWQDQREEGYAKLFKQENKYIVDGTTLTIYQNSALEYAQAHPCKALFFIREPSQRIYSTFKYFRDTRTVLPAGLSFDEFISEVENGNSFGGINQLSAVIEQSIYHRFIEKWIAILGVENVRVYDFRALKNDKKALMRDICEWLGIDQTIYDNFDFSHKNETAIVRNRTLNKVKEKIGVRIKNEKLKELIRPIYNSLNKKKPDNTANEQEGQVKERLRLDLAEDFNQSLKMVKEV